MKNKFLDQQARKQSIITPAILNELLDANYETGKLYWKCRDPKWFSKPTAAGSWNAKFTGKEAFTANHGFGYKLGFVLYTMFSAHRVIWAMKHNEWPEGTIDHINGIPNDNRIENLRVATAIEQANNKTPSHRSKTGLVNIHPYNGPDMIYVCIPALNIKKTFSSSEVDQAIAYRDEVRAAHGLLPARDKTARPLN